MHDVRQGWLGTALAGTIAAMGWGDGASASGFAIREQSGSFQGLSYAGVAAGGRDISTMYFNPATLGRHEGKQVHTSVSYIIPTARFQDGVADGGAITGPNGGDIASNAVVPATYAMIAAGDWRFGLGITAPFGLKTEQPRDWIGRYHATESELLTVNINPTVAYRFNDQLTVGVGFVAQYADATLENIVRLSPLAPVDGVAQVKGSDWDYGFTLGVLAEPLEGTRIGLGYRSQINHSLTGKRRVDTLAGTRLSTVGGRSSLQTPQIASLGVAQEIGSEWTVLGTVEWTGWSTFDNLIVTFDDGSAPSVTKQNWRDTWFFALGAEYQPRPDLVLQAGVAYDQTPNRDAYRTPRIPDADRTWISVGADWQPFDWARIGAAYSRIFVKDGRIDLREDPVAPGSRGSLSGRFDNGVDIVMVHGSLRF